MKATGEWYAANGGAELPYLTREGARVLYVFNYGTREHGYLNLDNDLVYKDENLKELF